MELRYAGCRPKKRLSTGGQTIPVAAKASIVAMLIEELISEILEILSEVAPDEWIHGRQHYTPGNTGHLAICSLA